MKIKIAILSLLIIIPIGYSLETEQLEVYETEEDVKDFQIDGKTLFWTSNNILQKTSDEGPIWSKTNSQYTGVEINDDYVLSGTRNPGTQVFLYEHSGEKKFEESIGNWVDTLSIYEEDNETYFGAGTTDLLTIFESDGSVKSEFSGGGYSRYASNQFHDISKNGSKKLLFGGGGRPTFARFHAATIDGELKWETDLKDDTARGFWAPEEGVVVYWGSGISLKNPEDGSNIWRKTLDYRPDPVNLSDSVVYSTDNELLFRSYSDGSVKRSVDVDSRVENLEFYPGKDVFVGTQENNLSFFSEEGEKLETRSFDNLGGSIRFTDFNSDGSKDIAVKDGNKVKVFSVESRQETVDRDLEDTVFVGEDKHVLQAAALNQTVFIGDSFEELDVNRSKVVGTGSVDGVENVRNVNEAFNISKPGYYVESLDQAVYVAAFASMDNASLTFDRSEKDKDFSSYSREELKKKFVDRFQPNHVAVADLESETGLLAGYMAAEQEILPLHLDSSEKVEETVETGFDTIGDNENTLFQGRYISILEGSPKKVENPVDGFFEDSDGEYYVSDLGHGTFEGELVDAAVGRYPNDVTEASLVFNRSKKGNDWDEATVASSYLHSNWPVILSTAGGGMRHGNAVDAIIGSGMETDLLVEHRADPVDFLISLTPVEILQFLEEANQIEELLEEFVSEAVASSVRNLFIALEVLNYAQQIMEMYYEYDWRTMGIDFDRSFERLDELELPEDDTLAGSAQEAVAQALYLLIWPDRHTELNETTLESSLDNDFVYYRGVGNQSEWILPNDESGWIDDRYTGENSFKPEDIPETRGVIFDSSDNAGTGSMKTGFLEAGASAYLGFSSVNYAEYSSVIDQNFLRYGETVGSSKKKGVNSLRKGQLVLSPSTVHLSGVREKMENSLMLYGNPETGKPSFGTNTYSFNHSCSEDLCTLKAEKKPDIEEVETGDRKILSFEADGYVLEPGQPITPLYSFEYPLPGELKEVREDSRYVETEAEVQDLDLLTHQETYINESAETSRFPEKRWNKTVEENDLTFVQTGLQTKKDGKQVLKNSYVEIDYKPAVKVGLKQVNGTLNALVNSSSSFEADLIYSIDNKTFSKEKYVSEGENRFELEELGNGEIDVELYVYEDDMKGYGQETFRNPEAIDVSIPEQSVRKGYPEKLEVQLVNPNSFSTEEKVEIDTGEKLQKSLLEEPVREVKLGSEEVKTVSWKLTGIEEGVSGIAVNGEEKNIDVEPAYSSNYSVSKTLYRSVVSPEESFSYEKDSENINAEIISPEASLFVSQSSERTETVLVTDRFRVGKVFEKTKIRRFLEKDDGRYVEVQRNGNRYTDSTGVGREQFVAKQEILKDEYDKLLARLDK